MKLTLTMLVLLVVGRLLFDARTLFSVYLSNYWLSLSTLRCFHATVLLKYQIIRKRGKMSGCKQT